MSIKTETNFFSQKSFVLQPLSAWSIKITYVFTAKELFRKYRCTYMKPANIVVL